MRRRYTTLLLLAPLAAGCATASSRISSETLDGWVQIAEDPDRVVYADTASAVMLENGRLQMWTWQEYRQTPPAMPWGRVTGNRSLRQYDCANRLERRMDWHWVRVDGGTVREPDWNQRENFREWSPVLPEPTPQRVFDEVCRLGAEQKGSEPDRLEGGEEEPLEAADRHRRELGAPARSTKVSRRPCIISARTSAASIRLSVASKSSRSASTSSARSRRRRRRHPRRE